MGVNLTAERAAQSQIVAPTTSHAVRYDGCQRWLLTMVANISTAAPTHPPWRRWMILSIPNVYWLAYEDFTFVKFTAVTPSGLYCRQFYKYKINEEINGGRKQKYRLVFPFPSGFYLSSSLGAPISPSVHIKVFLCPPPDPPEGGGLMRPPYGRPPRGLATLGLEYFS